MHNVMKINSHVPGENGGLLYMYFNFNFKSSLLHLFLHFSGSGVYFGQLDFNPQESSDNITTETKLLQYLNLNYLLINY